jgi:hypothetical protein
MIYTHIPYATDPAMPAVGIFKPELLLDKLIAFLYERVKVNYDFRTKMIGECGQLNKRAFKRVLLSRSKARWLVDLRGLIAYVLREYTKLTVTAIGVLIGERNYSTINHAHNSIATLFDYEPKHPFTQFARPLLPEIKQLIKEYR